MAETTNFQRIHKDKLEVAKMLVLSTGHLTEHTCDKWLTNCPWACFPKRNADDEFGWFMYVPDDYAAIDDMPQDLWRCIEWAEAEGCTWIMFDRDGPQIDGLTFYDW